MMVDGVREPLCVPNITYMFDGIGVIPESIQL